MSRVNRIEQDATEMTFSQHVVPTEHRRLTTSPLLDGDLSPKTAIICPSTEYVLRLTEVRVKELTEDAGKIGITFRRYLHELFSYTFYSGYPKIREIVMEKAKMKKLIRESRNE